MSLEHCLISASLVVWFSNSPKAESSTRFWVQGVCCGDHSQGGEEAGGGRREHQCREAWLSWLPPWITVVQSHWRLPVKPHRMRLRIVPVTILEHSYWFSYSLGCGLLPQTLTLQHLWTIFSVLNSLSGHQRRQKKKKKKKAERPPSRHLRWGLVTMWNCPAHLTLHQAGRWWHVVS